MAKTLNNEFRTFCLDNQILPMEHRKTLFSECQLVLSFLSEHDLSFSEESYRLVVKLHSSEPSNRISFEQEWLDDLKTIRILPSFAVLKEVKDLIEEVADAWVQSCSSGAQ